LRRSPLWSWKGRVPFAVPSLVQSVTPLVSLALWPAKKSWVADLLDQSVI
jgi:hypothetical protein